MAGLRDRWLWIFSVVGSCIVGHNERWRRGRRRGEEWMRDCGCFSVWEKMSDQVLSNDSRGWTCMNKEQFLFASQASEVQHEHRTICQSENRLFCMTYFCSCVSVSGLLTDLWWAGPSHQRPFSSSYMQQTRFGCIWVEIWPLVSWFILNVTLLLSLATT